MNEQGITLLLAGDFVTGRGVDQILGHPGDPTLVESSVRDARVYVALAEKIHGRDRGQRGLLRLGWDERGKRELAEKQGGEHATTRT